MARAALSRKETGVTLSVLNSEIIACERCPRLREHCRIVAEVRRRAYRDQTYWGKPVPGFGDPLARLLILGLAPGAHGANRTGRMFTGDSSGDFLYGVLHEAGFASQPRSIHRYDGLLLRDAYITASGRCAPPDNKPTRAELRNCRPFLEQELRLLPNVVVIVALGRIAFDSYLSIIKYSKSKLAFSHNAKHVISAGSPVLITSYHPSQQNTSTGKLTRPMLLDVFLSAREVIDQVSNVRLHPGID